MNRAERRRAMKDDGKNVVGVIGCKFCKSTKGTYERVGNRFFCQTNGCRGNFVGRGTEV